MRPSQTGAPALRGEEPAVCGQEAGMARTYCVSGRASFVQ